MEVCKNLKDNSKTANIKVIAISGDLRHSEKVILDAGAEIYFTKPVDFDTLLTVLQRICGAGRKHLTLLRPSFLQCHHSPGAAMLRLPAPKSHHSSAHKYLIQRHPDACG